MTHRSTTIAAVLCLFTLSGPADGAKKTSVLPTPEQDDATLRAVQYIGSRQVVAAGDRGTFWKSLDGGVSWHFVATPTDGSIRSVCFLTDRIGWLAGGVVRPYSRIAAGTLLFTNDGGETWETRSSPALPFLHQVRFFDLENGIAIGERTETHPTGLLRTKDGGKTWSSVEGTASAGWVTGDFLSVDNGFVAGRSGSRATVAGNLLPSVQPQEMRTIRSATLHADGTGWLAGDGGLVLKTDAFGVRWSQPAAGLPRSVPDLFDFSAIAASGPNVWIAGSPGSVIWHSPDAGQHWQAQSTKHAAPIQAIATNKNGAAVAVGEFGIIHNRSTGSEHWQTVRGGSRRASILALHTRPSRVSLQLVGRYGRADGHRVVLAMPSSSEEETARSRLELRLQQAVSAAGGAATSIGWRLPQDVPDVDRSQSDLLEHWQEITDGRAAEVLVGQLALAIRTWRPEIIVFDEAAADDALTSTVNQAILRAVESAADPTQFAEHRAVAALEPWKVRRVFQRLPVGESSALLIEPHERYGSLPGTLAMAVDTAYARLSDRCITRGEIEAYARADAGPTLGQDLFAGLVLQPGGDVRRRLNSSEGDADELDRIARHQRNVSGFVRQSLSDEATAANLLAELPTLIGPSPDDQAAVQLAEVARRHYELGQWNELAELAREMVRRFPQEPPTVEVALTTLRILNSAELQLASRARISKTRQSSDIAQAGLQQLSGSGSAAARVRQQDWHDTGKLDDKRYDTAQLLANYLKRHAAAEHDQPETQFLIAALGRKMERHGSADDIYRRFRSQHSDAAGTIWQRHAEQELWQLRQSAVVPAGLIGCRRASAPPHLDGLLSDRCWQRAAEIRLEAGETSDLPSAMCFAAYDREFLYLAGRLHRSAGHAAADVQLAGRTHDADVVGFDRVTVSLDTDRDYATAFRLTIDERGWTHDTCTTTGLPEIPAQWDPKWYVAAKGEADLWSFEAAIPLAELAAHLPQRLSCWGVDLQRTIPAEGVIAHGANESDRQRRPTSLLRFE